MLDPQSSPWLFQYDKLIKLMTWDEFGPMTFGNLCKWEDHVLTWEDHVKNIGKTSGKTYGGLNPCRLQSRPPLPPPLPAPQIPQCHRWGRRGISSALPRAPTPRSAPCATRRPGSSSRSSGGPCARRPKTTRSAASGAPSDRVHHGVRGKPEW